MDRNRVDKRDFNRGWFSTVINAIDLPATTANVLSLSKGMGSASDTRCRRCRHQRSDTIKEICRAHLTTSRNCAKAAYYTAQVALRWRPCLVHHHCVLHWQLPLIRCGCLSELRSFLLFHLCRHKFWQKNPNQTPPRVRELPLPHLVRVSLRRFRCDKEMTASTVSTFRRHNSLKIQCTQTHRQ